MADNHSIDSTPAEAKPSATVMLLRDGEGAVEVLMLQRHSGADFGNAWVFPGGLAAVSDFERELDPYCSGRDDATASAELGLEDNGLGLWIAAIRECFEESGYLLARDFEGRLCQPGAESRRERFADYRVALASGEMTLREVCEAENLTLDVGALEYVSFWTTPVVARKRYATRFFVAAVPTDQECAPDGRETVNGEWVNAKALVADEGRIREMRLHPPTRASLQWLAGFGTTHEAMAAAAQLDKSSITEILPVIDPQSNKREVTLPDGSKVSF